MNNILAVIKAIVALLERSFASVKQPMMFNKKANNINTKNKTIMYLDNNGK
ncbi:hypothetical protein ABTM33_18855 [Acinetobacter baumannii]